MPETIIKIKQENDEKLKKKKKKGRYSENYVALIFVFGYYYYCYYLEIASLGITNSELIFRNVSLLYSALE